LSRAARGEFHAVAACDTIGASLREWEAGMRLVVRIGVGLLGSSMAMSAMTQSPSRTPFRELPENSAASSRQVRADFRTLLAGN